MSAVNARFQDWSRKGDNGDVVGSDDRTDLVEIRELVRGTSKTLAHLAQY
jgi:hypothetical protein